MCVCVDRQRNRERERERERERKRHSIKKRSRTVSIVLSIIPSDNACFEESLCLKVDIKSRYLILGSRAPIVANKT